MNELRDMRFAHDQLRPVLDLGVVIFKTERDRIARIVGPLDDLDQFAADKFMMPIMNFCVEGLL